MIQPETPRWQTRRRLADTAIPAKLEEWLCEKRSLTRKLRLRCGESFSLQLMSQRWERPLPDEITALRLGMGRVALVRQVRLLCGARPMVFARSVIPIHTLKDAPRRLARLGTRPLADVLFSDREIERGEMEFALLRPGTTLFELTTQALGGNADTMWGRRSMFLIKRKPLLVSEVFAPDIVDARR